MRKKRGQGNRKNGMGKEETIEEKINKMCDILRTGCTINNAARSAGIEPNTYYLWKKKAQDGIKPYSIFWFKIDRAIAEGEAILSGRIFDASKDDWRAAAHILERRYREGWGKQEQKIENHTHNNTVVQLTEESLKRLRELESKAIENEKIKRKLNDVFID